MNKNGQTCLSIWEHADIHKILQLQVVFGFGFTYLQNIHLSNQLVYCKYKQNDSFGRKGTRQKVDSKQDGYLYF